MLKKYGFLAAGAPAGPMGRLPLHHDSHDTQRRDIRTTRSVSLSSFVADRFLSISSERKKQCAILSVLLQATCGDLLEGELENLSVV